MNKRLISIWTMCLRTLGYAKAKAVIINSVSGAAAILAEIEALTLIVTDLTRQIERSSEGTTANKNLLRQALVESTEQNIAILIAFAAKGKNTTLSKEMKKLLKKIKGSSAIKLVARAGLVFDTFEENLAALTDWQVTALTQTAYQTQISDFQVALVKPKERVNELADIRKKVNACIEELSLKWIEMDDMLGPSAKLNPDFMEAYNHNREVVNPSTSKVAAMIQIQNAADYSPIHKAIVEAPFGSFKTTKKGNLRMKSVADGSWLVTVKRTGFLPESFQLNIVSGITTKEVIRLQAA